MRLAEAVSLYIAGRAGRGEVTAGTAADLKARLGSLVAACGPDLADLDYRAVAGWQAAVGDRRAATRRAYLSTVKVFCGWAVAEGLLAADPTVRCVRVRGRAGASRATCRRWPWPACGWCCRICGPR